MDEARDTAPRKRPERLRTRSEFSEVMRRGRRSRHRLLQLVALQTGGPTTRIGFSVGKHVGGAVVRNRFKRRLRMIVRDLHWQPGYDVVIVGRVGGDTADFQEISAAVRESASRLRLLQRPGA